ncbi:MAG: ABC transporter permease [Methylococcus sp.]|nr:ABC transporter permease [Methylococcus sp.]
MVSLARSSLVYDWRRYAAAVFAITFAGLLVLVQLALLLGLFGTVSVAIDQSDADLWIGYPKTQSVDLGRPLPPGSTVNAWMHRSVRRVEPLTFAIGDLRRPDGVAVSVFLYGIEPVPEGLAFARKLTPEQRRLLDEPDAVIIDVADQAKLGANVGALVEINGKRARIAGIVEGIRGVGTVSVLTSRASLRRFSPDLGTTTTYQLVALRSGARPARVAGEIADAGGIKRYGVWTAEDFSVQSQIYWLLESGVGIGTGFASALALLVGVVITSQTLGGAILASLKEFAALRALGVSNASLRQVVLEQSWWLGLIGLGLTGLLTAASAWLGDTAHVAMSFPWWLLLGVSAVILAVALGSGLLALRPLYQADPANLLR